MAIFNPLTSVPCYSRGRHLGVVLLFALSFPLTAEVWRLRRRANPLWGAPRIHGELQHLGLEVSERTVSRLMPRRRKAPYQSWRTFLDNHLGAIIAIDFFTVPTVSFRVLFVMVVLAHHRRRIVHFNVTANPTVVWTAQQMVEAFPQDSAPRFLIRDRDQIYGEEFCQRVKGMGIEEVITSARSPWQYPFVERVIGSLRRERLDHVIVVNENHLRRILKSYCQYYHRTRPHLALSKDAPEPRAKQPPNLGAVIEIAVVGGLAPVRASGSLMKSLKMQSRQTFGEPQVRNTLHLPPKNFSKNRT